MCRPNWIRGFCESGSSAGSQRVEKCNLPSGNWCTQGRVLPNGLTRDLRIDTFDALRTNAISAPVALALSFVMGKDVLEKEKEDAANGAGRLAGQTSRQAEFLFCR